MGNSVAREKIGIGLLAALLTASRAWAGCSETVVDMRWPEGAAHFSVEIADTDSERQLGLMHRDKMAASHGMLFVYDSPRPVAFWMKDTLIPLDMLFIGGDGRVRKIHENAVPLDRGAIPGGSDIQYVLEINGGLARKLGIVEGAELRHPAIDSQLAAWSCAGP